MIDEPVQNSCGSLRKLNSAVDHRIHSSAQVLRCSAISARHEGEFQHEIAIARDVEAVGRDAVEAQLVGHIVPVDRQLVPASAAAPRRQMIDAACGNRPAARGRARASRSRPANSAAASTGWARCRCV